MFLGDSTLRTLHSESKLLEKNLFLHTSLKQFLCKICTNIRYMVLNCQHKRNFDFVYQSCQYFCFKNQPSILHVQVDSAIPLNQHVRHKFYNNNKNMTAS